MIGGLPRFSVNVIVLELGTLEALIEESVKGFSKI
jgi:hypothetical protein